MLKCAQLFADDLTSKKLHFDVVDGRNGDVVIRFPYDGKVTSYIFNGDDGKYVSMYTVMESVPEDKAPNALVCCNELNAKYKWFKFYVDSDNDIIVQDDAILEPDSAAEECFELLIRRINIMNEVKPEVMRAIYA